jgi:uncharacterized protein (TIGR03083 family)
MPKQSPWPTIHAERAALADDLAGLGDERWATASQCGGWSVRDVLAHLTATATMTPPKFFVGFAGSGFNFERMANKNVQANLGSSPTDTLARFKAHAGDSTSPPGPVTTWLGETIVHAEDIRRPLGIAHDYPMDALQQVAGFYAGSNLLIGAKKRIDGLALRATDADWSIGTGPEVSGPMVSLVLAMTGRGGAVADLSGPGVDTLRSRMP